ncbi:serine acetyltransferase [Priestia flexa]|uniref:serine O-acetyltransferase n=1 Tax=Priestia flexa TaxID=86664 RepID=UPI00289234D9|nr:serine acetyltransferase [Priestia flexa]MDT2047777.1 serine acetyltransferase [Priestia flexa]
MKENKFTQLLFFKAWFKKKKIPLIPGILDFIYRVIFSCDIPSSVLIGRGSKFAHRGLGCVLHPRTKIGDDCKIFQKVTIGSRNGEGPPVVGDNVYIGAGACILGEIKIGNDVKIGANSVVLNDIPDGCIVVGIPGKIIKNEKT